MSSNTQKNLSYIIQRDAELDKIDVARKTNNVSIYPVKGGGGIGKTTLLNLYKERLLDSGFPESNILSYDFDDSRYHTTYQLRTAISEDLGEKNFTDYYKLQDEYLSIRLDPEVSNKRKDMLHAQVHQAWIEAIESIAEQNKLVILLDTLDALSTDERKELAKNFFQRPFKNVFFLVAGRDYATIHFIEKIKNYWSDTYKNQITDGVEIGSLDYEDYYLYCKNKCDEYGALLPWKKEDELNKKTHTITQGVPIIVDLFIKVVISDSENNFLNIIKQIPTKSIDSSKIEWFKEELIHRFSRSNKVNELVPLMEHVWPLNYKMLALLKDIDDSEAIMLMQLAKKSAFIKLLPDPYSKLFPNSEQPLPKFSIKLHDIMAELMRKYGWKYIDPEKKDRKEYSEKFLTIADNINKKLNSALANIANNTTKKLERNRLRTLQQNILIRKLKHTLFLDPIAGIRLFVKLFKESYGKKYVRNFYIKELFRQVGYYQPPESTIINKTNYFNTIDPQKHPKLIVDYLSIEADFWSGRDHARAQAVLANLQQLELSPEIFIELYDDMAEVRIKAGNFTSALHIIDKGIDYCRKNISEENKNLYRELFKLLTVKGWTLRLMGGIKAANKCYNEAYQLRTNKALKLSNTIDLIAWAHLLNTSSYAKAILREYKLAIEYSEEAKKIFKAKEDYKSLGMIESTRGRIEIEFDHYKQAKNHYKKALKHFSTENDKEWKSKIYLGLAQSYLLRGRYDHSVNDSKRQKCFKKAEDYFYKAEKYKNIAPADKAELFDLKAHLALAEGNYKDATSYYRTCERVATSMHSLFYQARGLFSQLRVASLTGDTSTFEGVNERYQKFLKNNPIAKEDSLSVALYQRYKGDIYMLMNETDKAFECYKEALPKIAKNGRYTPFNLNGQINGLTDFFLSHYQKINPEDQEEWLDNVREIAKKLIGYKTLSPEANETIFSWIDKKPEQWDNHTLTYIYENEKL